jgi:hypothetical protein
VKTPELELVTGDKFSHKLVKPLHFHFNPSPDIIELDEVSSKPRDLVLDNHIGILGQPG